MGTFSEYDLGSREQAANFAEEGVTVVGKATQQSMEKGTSAIVQGDAQMQPAIGGPVVWHHVCPSRRTP